MKDVLMKTRNGIIKIRNFAEEHPGKAEELELFTFTEKPEEISDLLMDLECAIEKIDVL